MDIGYIIIGYFILGKYRLSCLTLNRKLTTFKTHCPVSLDPTLRTAPAPKLLCLEGLFHSKHSLYYFGPHLKDTPVAMHSVHVTFTRS